MGLINPHNMTDVSTIAKFLNKDNEVVYIGYEGTEYETEWQQIHKKWLDRLAPNGMDIGWYIVNVGKDYYYHISDPQDAEVIKSPYFSLNQIGFIFQKMAIKTMPTNREQAYLIMMNTIKTLQGIG